MGEAAEGLRLLNLGNNEEKSSVKGGYTYSMLLQRKKGRREGRNQRKADSGSE